MADSVPRSAPTCRSNTDPFQASSSTQTSSRVLSSRSSVRVSSLHHLLQRGVGAPRHRLAQQVEALVQRPVAPLDQPVGVEQEAVALGQPHPGLGPVLRPGERTQGRGASVPEQPRLAVGGHEQRRRVPRAGVAELARRQVELGVGEGGHAGRLDLLDEPVQPRQQPARTHLGAGDRAHGAAQLAHRARRREAATDDVPHAQGQQPVGGEEGVVPVASDLQQLHPGPVGRGHGEARVGRRRDGQERALQLVGHARALLVTGAPGPGPGRPAGRRR